MRVRLFPLLMMTALACNRPQEAPQTAVGGADDRTYEVRKKGKLVLTVTDAPGPIVSTAVRPPDGSAAAHPFLSASAHAAEEEDALGRVLAQSKSTGDFLGRLRKAGYEVRERPHSRLAARGAGEP